MDNEQWLLEAICTMANRKTKIKQTCFDIPPVQQFPNLTSIGAKSDLPAAPY